MLLIGSGYDIQQSLRGERRKEYVQDILESSTYGKDHILLVIFRG